ncbi:MAG: hypothetical protein K0R28_4494, partial [Paenibacillus sp.]|nr:hypothetical protein [Paenibacillus sp.]
FFVLNCDYYCRSDVLLHRFILIYQNIQKILNYCKVFLKWACKYDILIIRKTAEDDPDEGADTTEVFPDKDLPLSLHPAEGEHALST